MCDCGDEFVDVFFFVELVDIDDVVIGFGFEIGCVCGCVDVV